MAAVMPPRHAASRAAGDRGRCVRILSREAGEDSLCAFRHRVGTAVAKRTADEAGRDTWHHPGNAAERRTAQRAARHRNAGQQPARVRVGRRGEQRLDRRALHHLAGVHHRYALRHARDDAEIVGDQQQRQAKLALQRLQQSQDLRLHRDVQSGGRLVGDQQLRLAHQRGGDHHPLAQSTGKLVRVLPQPHPRRGDADPDEQLRRTIHGLNARHASVAPQYLGHLRTDRVGRVEAGHRLLKDHGHLVTTQPRHAALGQAQQVGVVKAQHVGAAFGAACQQVHHRQGGRRLAAAGFTHQAVRLTAVHRQSRAAHRRHTAAERDVQVGNFQDGSHRCRPVPNRPPNPSPSRLMPSTSTNRATPGTMMTQGEKNM